jgi:universal stress protein E
MSTFHRILVAIKDPWARTLPAVDKAAQLARALDAPMQLFHGMTDPVYVDLAETNGDGLMSLEESRRARAGRRLETIARRLERAGIHASAIVEWDFPAHEAVIRAARRYGADLIVAERHATSHHLPWLLRFTDFELLRLAPVPVLLVKTRERYVRPRILAAIDPGHAYSKPIRLDREILRYGKAFSHALHGSLHALYAFEPLPIGGMASEVPMGEAAEVIETVTEERARNALDRALNRTRIPQSRRHLIPRHPSDAIESVAREIGSSIVVMGAVSRSGLKRLVLGNTAERVLDRLPCDVLVVKPKEFTSRVPRTRRGAQLIAVSALSAGI